MNHKRSLWVPGCGAPHPDIELIKAWAEGKVPLVDKQRVAGGKPFGSPLHQQYPCWQPGDWQFEVAKNTQLALDLDNNLVSQRRVKVEPFKKPGVSRVSKFSNFR